MFPIRTEKAAEELKPEPAGRVLLITASKPPFGGVHSQLFEIYLKRFIPAGGDVY